MLYTIRTTVGQERIVADLLRAKQSKAENDIYSIAVIDNLRGYIFVEAPNEAEVKKFVYNVPHVKGLVPGGVDLSEVAHFFELTAGPFKGEKAKVKRVDESKDKITLELIEATVPIPITMDAASVRVISQSKEE